MFEVPSSANAPIAQPASRKGIWLGLGVLGLVAVIVGIWLLRVRGADEAVPLVPAARTQGTANGAPSVPTQPEPVQAEPAFAKDTDGDGVSDEEEARYKTDPGKADTDGDGMTDLEEIFVRKTDPLVPDAPRLHPFGEPSAPIPSP